MIVFLTTAACMKPLGSFTGPGFGASLPEIRVESYEAVLRQTRLPEATYVFCDLERLSAFELRIAGSLQRAIAGTGMRTLNNPARVKLRYELLRELALRGLNPFSVYRCDDRPRPNRFPVFLRFESGHAMYPELIPDQAALDKAIETFRQAGHSATGMLAVECCPTDQIEGRWFKWGAFAVAEEVMLDHIAVDDNWLVKWGRWEQLTPGIVELENVAVRENWHADFVAETFKIAEIEFGRADFSRSGHKPVMFEINTNPYVHDLKPDPHLLRRESQTMARERLAAALFKIDSGTRGLVDIPGDTFIDYCRSTEPGSMIAPRV
jgi:hypothetical protein